MDRKTAYRGELAYETDLLLAQRYAYEGLGLLALDLLGATTMVAGLACTPSAPAALTVKVGPGRIYSLQNLEPTVWGQLLGVGGLIADLATDHQILKQGVLRDTTTLTGFVAPATGGQSINYLIQASFQETDGGLVNRQFYNTQAPANPIVQGVFDARLDGLVLSVKAGAAAATGSQTTPAADAGCVPVWVVTVANGQTTITAPNIAQSPLAPVMQNVTGQAYYTFAKLPTAPVFRRAFCTDSSVVAAGNFGANVAGGGANLVPIYWDTNSSTWRIG